MIYKTATIILWISLACYFPTQCSKELANEETKHQKYIK